MSNVGLYLGTFNPIHNGHVTLAEYFSKLPELDEVLVVISPQSPFKKEDGLINDKERLEMAEIALWLRKKQSNQTKFKTKSTISSKTPWIFHFL